MKPFTGKVVVLTGGIGGAKLVLGLSKVLKPELLTAIVNTGDDFEHLGLPISPDLDTLMYTLANIVNPETGWGLNDETWNFMAAVERLQGETWFRLGDRDVATHVMRAQEMAKGQSLTAITAKLCRHLGVAINVLPMSDTPVRTQLVTETGRLDFQHYFVRDLAKPRVRSIHFRGANAAMPNPAVIKALSDPELAAIIIAPSNPYLSIDPIISIPALRQAILSADAPVIAVSPIVKGAAIKGPTAKIMRELNIEPSAAAVARHYGELIDAFIVDEEDSSMTSQIQSMEIAILTCNTVMTSLEDKTTLARAALEFAQSLTH